jgi:hypothetical protein
MISRAGLKITMIVLTVIGLGVAAGSHSGRARRALGDGLLARRDHPVIPA